MDNERVFIKIYSELLFELARLVKTKDAKKRDELIMALYLRLQMGMTKEEIAEAEKMAIMMIEQEEISEN